MKTTQSRLLDLLRGASVARKVLATPEPALGVAEIEPFPFLAIVGQEEMKLALILAIINPMVGGVLLIGSRGTAKTTAVRSLVDLLPNRRRSVCPNGCTEEMLERYGMEGICDDCAKRVGYGEPLTVEERVRIVELPLHSRLDDVIGGINERIAMEQQRVRLQRGILANADGNVLYIDEVNLLDTAVTNAILDAAAQGFYMVRRGPVSLRFSSQFMLVGSMNPAEGELRPQIMERFGLRAIVRGLRNEDMRYLAYQQSLAYHTDPEQFSLSYATPTLNLAEEISRAKARLPAVKISEEAKQKGLHLVKELGIESNRAEISLFEAARAHCAADDRDEVSADDISQVALLALRFRQSDTLNAFYREQDQEDSTLRKLLGSDEGDGVGGEEPNA